MSRIQYGWVRVEQGKFAQRALADGLAAPKGKIARQTVRRGKTVISRSGESPPGFNG